MALFESILAFFTAVSECAKAKQSSIEHRLELKSIKENDRQETAIKAANKAFDLMLQNLNYLPQSVKREFLRYKKTFDRNIT